MNKKWTAEQNLYIMENADKIKDAEMVIKLSEIFGVQVKLDCLRKHRQRLGRKKLSGRGINKIKQ